MREMLSSLAPYLLSLLRIVLALLFIKYGSMKLFGFPPSEQFANLKLLTLVGLAGVLELVGGLFLLLRLFTRPTAFVLSGLMSAAYFFCPRLTQLLSWFKYGRGCRNLLLPIPLSGGRRWRTVECRSVTGISGKPVSGVDATNLPIWHYTGYGATYVASK